MLTEPSLDHLAGIVSKCLEKQAIPAHSKEAYEDAISKVLARAVGRFGPNTEVELVGSQKKGTEVGGSDADFVIVTGHVVTRSMRQKLQDDLKEEFFGCKSKTGPNAISFEEVRISPHLTTLKFDVTFEETSFGRGGARASTDDLPRAVQLAVRLFKIFHRTNGNLPAMSGMHYEMIATYAFRQLPALKTTCDVTLERGTLLVFSESLRILSSVRNSVELVDRLREVAPGIPDVFLSPGQLEQWSNHGRTLITNLEICQIQNEGDLVKVLVGRADFLPRRTIALDLRSIAKRLSAYTPHHTHDVLPFFELATFFTIVDSNYSFIHQSITISAAHSSCFAGENNFRSSTGMSRMSTAAYFGAGDAGPYLAYAPAPCP
ncbi:hypothetical protein HK097_011393 [Rhizophlyctis rosea]|uniref:Polymerase nucleotidyl transferase domain-containing protein n=1 Tax=Rhizophlyctis rosea TaxID=64517 RepID=A0AAD5X1X5_9FUNG|nr:hypothetical protein HK097_011393 [Rhizophlyctis rosea]